MVNQYKLYYDGADVCVQAINNKWYAVEHKNNEVQYEEYLTKPNRFKSSKLLTLAEIEKKYDLINKRYFGTKYIIIDNSSVAEIIQSANDKVSCLNTCRKEGWVLNETIMDGNMNISIPFKSI